ncbi:Ankyrin repeat-containing domain [Lasallia pustulata]|uniref:Ankyrin repeat-containing domain n=1 Tax=Lasallia pustulata TaxID=136370 RepID=A0A1W5D864_9LECA|nr:Ankyrin repeat-containing domain [Lasallia pustulata]
MDVFNRWLNGNERILWCPGIREKFLRESSRVLAPLLTGQKLGQVKPYLRTYNGYSIRPISYITRSTVIDHLQRTYSTSNIGIAFMYCDYKEQEQQTPVNLISSLLQQLVEQQSSVPDEVRSLWEEHTRRRTRPCLAECSRLLQSTASAFSEIFIVIDALDESSEITRDDLIAEIQKLPSHLHLMATSRHNPNIEQLFNGSIQLEIQAHDADVKAYIRTQIDKRERLKKFVRADPRLQGMIETKLASKAQGMFLLPRLHIESLAEKHDRKAVRLALERLPEKLNETYDGALRRIRSQNNEDVRLARRVLTWISFATRPLKVEEMRHAIAVMNLEPGEKHIEDDGLPDKDLLLTVCAGIVIIDTESDIIRLVHYTAQEYFEQKRMQEFPNAQAKIAKACLTYLSLDTFMDGPCPEDEAMEDRLLSNPLLHYAAQNWGFHVQGSPEKTLLADILNFLNVSTSSESAIQASKTAGRHRHPGWSQRYPSSVPGIAYAASAGLTEIVGCLLDENCSTNASGSDGKTALHIAAESGHEALIKLLLERGADFNLRDQWGRTAMSEAAANGHEAVVKLLLERGADINLKADDGRTALSAAARWKHEAVVELLLEQGADIDLEDQWGWTALSLAAANGHEAVVKLLLEQGADIDLKVYDGPTALLIAALYGKAAVVKLLLKHGAKIDSKGRDGQTALSYAAEKGHEVVVKLLLEQGAEVDSKARDGRTALLFAAMCGHEAVVKLLLEHGAKVDSKNRNGQRTPFEVARWNHEVVVKALLEQGADADLED